MTLIFFISNIVDAYEIVKVFHVFMAFYTCNWSTFFCIISSGFGGEAIKFFFSLSAHSTRSRHRDDKRIDKRKKKNFQRWRWWWLWWFGDDRRMRFGARSHDFLIRRKKKIEWRGKKGKQPRGGDDAEKKAPRLFRPINKFVHRNWRLNNSAHKNKFIEYWKLRERTRDAFIQSTPFLNCKKNFFFGRRRSARVFK